MNLAAKTKAIVTSAAVIVYTCKYSYLLTYLLTLCDCTWIFNGCWANVDDRMPAVALTWSEGTQ